MWHLAGIVFVPKQWLEKYSAPRVFLYLTGEELFFRPDVTEFCQRNRACARRGPREKKEKEEEEKNEFQRGGCASEQLVRKKKFI